MQRKLCGIMRGRLPDKLGKGFGVKYLDVVNTDIEFESCDKEETGRNGMEKRKMVKTGRNRVLTGFLCALLFVSEAAFPGFRSYAAEVGPVTETGLVEEEETEKTEIKLEIEEPEEKAEVIDGAVNEETQEPTEGENPENPENPDEQNEEDVKGDGTDQNGEDMPTVSENTENVEEEAGTTGEDFALTTSADDIASGIVDESYGHIEWVIDRDGKLTVRGWGDYAEKAGASRAPWFLDRGSVKTAEINVSGMMNASYMFYNCAYMTNIDMSNFDTSNIMNMHGMFYGCQSLSYIDLSSVDTSSVTDMGYVFYECYNLKSVNLSGVDTGNVIDMRAMFEYCTSLESIDLSGLNVGNVTNMYEMFEHCINLKSVDLENMDVGSVTTMAWMFSGCNNLTSVNLNGLKAGNVSNMGLMFFGCSKLNSVNLESVDTSSVMNLGGMFEDCSSLIGIDLSSLDTDNVTNMNGMFQGCSGLSNIDLSNLNTHNVKSMAGMFQGCSNLSSINMSGCDFSNVSNMDYMFAGCTNLTTIYSPYNVTTICTLPANSGDIWYCSDGTTVNELPKNLNHTVALGRNYIPTEKTDDFYIDEKSNHKYKLFDESMEWEKAKEYCEGLGGHLVTITSETEQEFVTAIAEKSKKKNIWLGAEMVSGEFFWITGEKFAYKNWNDGEPNNVNNNQNTIMMYTYSGINSDGYSITPGVWNDESKQGRNWPGYTVNDTGFICEWDQVEDITDREFFNEFTYRADKLHDTSLAIGKNLKECIEMDTPSNILIAEGRDSGMNGATVAWEGLSVLFDSLDDVTSLYNFTVEEKDIYTAIILNALEVSTEYDAVDSCEAIIKDSKTYVSEINKWAKNMYKMDISEQKNFQNLNQKQKEELADEAEKLFKKNFNSDLQSLNKVFKNFDTILKYSDNLETYLEKISSNLAMANLSESMKIVIRTMYANCPDSNIAMKLALSDCITIIDATTDEFINRMLTEGFNIVGEETAKYLVRELWNGMKKSLNAGFPALDVLLAGYKLGKYISNTFMNTDDTVEKYHKMSAVVSFEAVLDDTYRTLSNQYMNSKSEKDASAYLSAIDLLFSFRDQDCVSAYEFVDTLDQATINKIAKLFQGDGDNNYEKVKKSISSRQGSYTTEYESCLTSWIYDLDEDYPDRGLYEIFKHRLDDSYNRILKKKYLVACPVDVYVYDSNDKLVAYVENNKPYCSGNMTVAVSGEQKSFYFYDDNEYRMECIGNDGGTMDIEISEFNNQEEETREVYFYDIDLEKDKKYETEVRGSSSVPLAYQFTEDTGDTVVPDFDTEIQEDRNTKYKLKINSGTAVVNGELKEETDIYADATVELRAFVADGYEFVEWISDNTSAVFEDHLKQITTLRMPNADILVTAVIRDKKGNIIIPPSKENTKVNVFFSVRNHGALPQPYIGIEKGSKIEEPPIPTAESYTFIGWFKEKDCINKWDFATDMVQEDITLYAGWIESGVEKLYRVSFDTLNHGIMPEAYTEVKENSRISEPEVPTADGYRFIGWFKDNKCTVRWQFAADTVTSDMTLYAGWVPDDDFGDVLSEDIPASGKIPSGIWIAAVSDYLYTGKPIKPDAHVYDSKTRLKKGQDYTITYKNNTKAGDGSASAKAPTIVVKGKGNYAGTETETFTIRRVSLNNSEIVCDSITTVYTGKVQKRIPIISYGGKKLSINKDFTVSYPDLERNITEAYCAPGTYDILLTAKEGNYAGTRTVKFIITKNTPLSRVSVKRIPNQQYTGQAVEPELTVALQNTPLIKNKDYTVTYTNNKQAGKATVILTGRGNYAGTKKVTFNIIGTSLKKAKVSKISAQTYNGLEQKPNVSLSVDGILLKNGTDYQIAYANNLHVGTGTITIKGINAYTGSIKKTFRINAYDLNGNIGNKIGGLQAKIVSKYMKGGSKPKLELTFAGKKLTEGTDYTLSYKNNKTLTATGMRKLPTVTVKGKGNFKGSISKSFTIVSKALNDKEFPVTLRVADKGFTDKPGNFISKPTLIDSDGEKLVAGKDYDENVIYLKENGIRLDKTDELIVGEKVRVKIKGKGAYSGELEAVYIITPEDFSKAKITVTSKPYTGKKIMLDGDDIMVKLNGSELSFATDYEIVDGSYNNNLKKGLAEVTIAGKGKYGGMKTVKFRIISKKFQWFWRILQ